MLKIRKNTLLLLIICAALVGCFAFKSEKIKLLSMSLDFERIVWNRSETLILKFEISKTSSDSTNLFFTANAFRILLIDSHYARQEYFHRDLLFTGAKILQTTRDTSATTGERYEVTVEFQCADLDLLQNDSVLAMCIYNTTGEKSELSGGSFIGSTSQFFRIVPVEP